MTAIPSIEAKIQALAQLDRQRAEIEAQIQTLQSGAVEPEPMAKAERPNRRRLTKSSVAALPVPKEKNGIYWDADLGGFGLRISPHGTKTYFLQARTKNGRGIKVTLGRASRITAEQARDAARRHLAALDLGRDPAAELKAAREAERERRQAPDLSALWRDFEAKHLPALREKSRAAYSSWWRVHIEPRLGKAKLADVSRAKVEQLHREVAVGSGGPTANRCLAVLSALMSHAEKIGLVAANPCRGVKRAKEHARERDLSAAELRRLLAFLAASSAPEARLIEFLLSTGARKGEAIAARWQDIRDDWWHVPAAVSKSKKAQRKPLNAAALAVLANLDPRGALLFPEVTPSRLGKWWLSTRAELGLGDCHLHDLRHAAASLALNAGVPLAAVGAMLGHGVNSASMTARYSHLADEQLAKAARELGDRLEALRAMPPVGRA